MTTLSTALRSAAIGATALALLAAIAPGAMAATAKKAAHKAPAAATVPEATPQQTDAAGRVFYGTYACDANQSVQVSANDKHASYVDLKHGKAVYLMKPVLSETGAIRLEDVKGQALLVQIAAKSMLMNVKSGQRIADGCVSQKQRDVQSATPAP